MTSAWQPYYDKAGHGPPRPTLLKALDALARDGMTSGHAVDLGCGVGRDALELLRRGWSVTAIDANPAALAELAARAQALGLPPPATLAEPFETAAIPPCRLVNASFSLFFSEPARFPDLWRRIRAALLPGGRFSGQLLGPEDSWAGRPGVTCLDEAALDRLLGGYLVEQRERETTDSVTPRGEAKRWDIWHLVLRRP